MYLLPLKNKCAGVGGGGWFFGSVFFKFYLKTGVFLGPKAFSVMGMSFQLKIGRKKYFPVSYIDSMGCFLFQRQCIVAYIS